MANKRYDLFIAYHGTNDPNGTYGVAKEICSALKAEGYEVYLHNFSYAEEHKDIQWNRTWEVVDDCQCFLAIINDNVPRSSSGRLGNDFGEQVSQIREEVDSFYDLINRNMRNRNDFNFYYAGNKMLGQEQDNFFSSLHSQILNGHNTTLAWNNGDYKTNVEIIKKWLVERGCSIDNEEKQLKKLRELLEKLGWGKSILFSPKELRIYEEKISRELKQLTLIAANTTDDVKGGQIFPLVEKNLTRGVKYTYLFFDYPGAKKQLESIYDGHKPENRENLELFLVKSKAWFAADILLIKIYEFNENLRPEIFFRIKMSTDSSSEQCIYIKGANNKIPIIQQEIEDLLEEQKVIKYTGEGWEASKIS